MSVFKISFTLICVFGFITIQSSFAQNSPQAYLNVHNSARDEVHAGLRHMVWDGKLEDYARKYARIRSKDCRLVHSNGPYGENLAGSSGDLSGADAVRLWVNEKQFYNYRTNSCAHGRVCGHYTQVVWRPTVKVGCAKVRCNNGGTFIICSYHPKGNIGGRKPY